MAKAETDTTHGENASANQSTAEKDAFVRRLQDVKKESDKGKQRLGLVTNVETTSDALEMRYRETGAVPESLPVPRDPCAEEYEDAAGTVAQLEAENERGSALVTRTLSVFAESEGPGEINGQQRVVEDLNVAQEKPVAQQRLADERLEALEAAQRVIDRRQRGLAQAQGDLESHRRVSEEPLRKACDQLISRYQRVQEKLESEHLAVKKLWQGINLLEKRHEEWKQKSENDRRVSEKLLHDFNSVGREFDELKRKVHTQIQELAAVKKEKSEILSLEEQLANAHRERQAAEDRFEKLQIKHRKWSEEFAKKESAINCLKAEVRRLQENMKKPSRMDAEIQTEPTVEFDERGINELMAEYTKLQAELKWRNQAVPARNWAADGETKKLQQKLEKTERQLVEIHGIAEEFTDVVEQERAKSVQISIECAKNHDDMLKAREELETKVSQVIILKEENMKLQNQVEDHMRSIQLSTEDITQLDKERTKYRNDWLEAQQSLEIKVFELTKLKMANSRLQHRMEFYEKLYQSTRELVAQISTHLGTCRQDLWKAYKKSNSMSSEVSMLREENRNLQNQLVDYRSSTHKFSQIRIERDKYHDDLGKMYEVLKTKVSEAITLKKEIIKLQNQQEDYVRAIQESKERIAQLEGENKRLETVLSHQQPVAGNLFVTPGAGCSPVNNGTTAAATTATTTAESSPIGQPSCRDSFGTLVNGDVRLRETEERLAAVEAWNRDLQHALEAAKATLDVKEKIIHCINRSFDYFIQDSNEKDCLITVLKQWCLSMQILQTPGMKCLNDIQDGDHRESITDSSDKLADSVVNLSKSGTSLPDARPDDTIHQTVKATVEKIDEKFVVLRQDTERPVMAKGSLAMNLRMFQLRLQEAQQGALKIPVGGCAPSERDETN